MPLIGIVFYRAHLVAGNTQFVTDVCDAIEAGGADVFAIWSYSLRGEAAQRPSTCSPRSTSTC